MKVCNKCKIEKDTTEFSIKKNNKLQSYCRACNTTYNKLHYQNNKFKYKTKTKEYNINYRKVLEDFLWNYLTSHPCIDCGESNPIVLEFDHIKGNKSFNISQSFSRKFSLTKISEEISKCEVRCSNCHKIKTAKDFNWWTFKRLSSNG